MLQNPAQELFLRKVLPKLSTRLLSLTYISPRGSLHPHPESHHNTTHSLTNSPRKPNSPRSPIRDPNAEISSELSAQTGILEHMGASAEIPIDLSFSPVLTVTPPPAISHKSIIFVLYLKLWLFWVLD